MESVSTAGLLESQGFEHVFAPGRIGPVEIRNRIYISAQTTGFGVDGYPNERHRAYLAERAKGGVGLIFTEAVEVASMGPGPENPQRLSIADDGAVGPFGSLVGAIHEHGAAAFIQLTQTGHSRLWAPSAVRVSGVHPPPRELTTSEIDGLRTSFRSAARRARIAGFDGLEVHLGHGHLLHRFLSPVLNRRSDAYGGDLAGRLRFPLEVLAQVRDEVGAELAVGARVSSDDLTSIGPDETESVGILRSVIESGLVDFLNVSQGGATSSSGQVPDMTYGETPFIDLTERVVSQLPPVTFMTTGRFTRLESAERVLRSGRISYIGMTRAHTADADLIAKAIDPQAGTVRPCVACNFCADRAIAHGTGMACMVNPRVGNESAWPASTDIGPIRTDQHALVIGAGPAGMEFARVVASAGGSVEIWERESSIGGQLRDAAHAAVRGDFRLLVDYFDSELTRLGVKVRLGVEASAELVSEAEPAWCAVATGATQEPALDGVEPFRPGELEHWTGGHLCLVDFEGSWRTISAIEEWMERSGDGRLTVVTPGSTFLENLSPSFVRAPLVDRLSKRHVDVLTEYSVLQVHEGGLTVRSALTGEMRSVSGIDRLRSIAAGKAATTLSAELEAQGTRHVVVGDAFLPRDVLESMRAAHRAALEFLESIRVRV